MINAASKFVLLYFVSILTTVTIWVTVICIAVTYPDAVWLLDLLFTIDFGVNLFCLYTQFPFAVAHYNLCCGCLDSRFTHCVSARTKRAIHQNVHSVDTSTASL